MVYVFHMSRTNIDIDDALLKIVMQRYDLRTKTEAVDYSLRRLAGTPMTREEPSPCSEPSPISRCRRTKALDPHRTLDHPRRYIGVG